MRVATLSSSASSGPPSPPSTPETENSEPYPIGTSILLQRHSPHAPSGRRYAESGVHDADVPSDISQLDWCLAHPPEPGDTDVNDARSIIIEAGIRTGEHCGAQILLTTDGLVAKVYDPLHYRFLDQEWPQVKLNVTADANHDYAIEAAAYSQFRNTPFQGHIMPRYHGSWTTEVQTTVNGQQQPRDVRLILLEHVFGTRMLNIRPEALTTEERENIMYKLIEADVDLHFAGLEHDDLSPRNVILAVPSNRGSRTTEPPNQAPYADPNLRVCIIDYGLSCVNELIGEPLPGHEYLNPLFFWPPRDMWSDYGWLPPIEEARNWMWRMWGDGGRDGKYIKVERDPNNALGYPMNPLRTASR